MDGPHGLEEIQMRPGPFPALLLPLHVQRMPEHAYIVDSFSLFKVRNVVISARLAQGTSNEERAKAEVWLLDLANARYG